MSQREETAEEARRQREEADYLAAVARNTSIAKAGTPPYAHVYSIRLDAEGVTASAIEAKFAEWAERFEQATDVPMNLVRQVIELSGNDPTFKEGTTLPTWHGTWFKGRAVISPELTAQGYDPDNGMRKSQHDRSFAAEDDLLNEIPSSERRK